jgi:hypothetical protein
MPTVDRNRLQALEGKFGASFPADFVASLSERELISQEGLAFVAGDIVWDVRTTFGLNGLRTDYSQLDRVNDLVGDAMPPGALPFAEHWGGEDSSSMPLKGAPFRHRRRRIDDARARQTSGG